MKDFTENDLTKRYILSDDGTPINKIYLNYVDDEKEEALCDCCNQFKQCVHLFMLCGDSAVICKDCLKLIIKSFDD
jgi:hypothetical protein